LWSLISPAHGIGVAIGMKPDFSTLGFALIWAFGFIEEHIIGSSFIPFVMNPIDLVIIKIIKIVRV
jgi:hypothetical protein